MSYVRPLRPPWFVLGCCALLALAVAFEARPVSRDAPPAAVPSHRETAAYEVPRSLVPPASRYREIAERPLFVPDRRPQQNLEPQQAATAQPSDFIVEGVVLSPERRAAIIGYGHPPRTESVLEGAMVDGWRVERIDPSRVLLSADGRTVALAIGQGRSTPPHEPLRASRARP
ncbi:MAG: hypothetical protein ACREFQ_16265 [Stellaceae bacterium]